ncbi:unnamed protein product [Durusdinium trenchii]|uniref:Uncharacterized protein n=1 Tax=Durusdinium trenchii TaxID=1381693 RepID=A0ABP0HJ25_9DINO
MRVDATEFVPANYQWGQPTERPQLSANTPAFVPGAAQAPWTSEWVWQEHPEAAEYSAAFQEEDAFDEESFLTPQLLPESSGVPQSASLSPKSSQEDDGNPPDWDPGLSSQASSHAAAGSGAGSAAGGSTVLPRLGVLAVEGRRLQWCIEGSDVGFSPEDCAQGEGVESQKFSVAGVLLRLAFFPNGTSMTGDGDCAVAVLCEEKTKLKFELFLNGRRSGAKESHQKTPVAP